MTFPLVPSQPFTAFITTIPASVLNAWRTSINEAIDGTGGGTYLPSTPLTINGSGMVIDPLSAYVRSGGYLRIDNGGEFTTIAGASVTFNSGVAFAGNTSFTGSANSVTAGTWGFYVDAYQLGGSTFHVGDTSLGVGHIVVDGRGSGNGSDITFKGAGGATWQTSSTATFLSGSVLNTDQPASNADTGANNIRVTDVARAWGEIGVNASASPAINDARNVSSVSASGTAVSVTFAHAMANTHYAVTFSTQSFNNGGQQWPAAFVVSKSTGGFSVEFRQGSQNTGTWNAGDLIAPTATGVVFPFSFTVHARQ